MSRPLTGAGGVVVRRESGGYVVLIGRRRENGEWRLPKGKIDPGETPEQAAIREIREETGVEAEIIVAIGDDLRPRSAKRIRFYLCGTRLPSQPYTDPEFDLIHWLPLPVAISLVGVDGERRLLREAERLLGRHQLTAA
jgi:8-oxo-dGTP pyrophosphatase MutT (NUDIX family)